MFSKAFLTAISLALIISASPSSTTPRTSLTLPDGTFDRDEAIRQTVKTANKHRQNLINLVENGGTLPDGPPSRLSRGVSPLRSQSARWSSDIPGQWLRSGSIAIGTPHQPFLSTSIPARLTSGTSVSQPGTFSIEYGDQSTVSGPVYSDTGVGIGRWTVTNQTFSAFADAPEDGILGLAYPEISNLHAVLNLLENAYQQGVVAQNDFAFKLTTGDSSLYLGGTDEFLYNGEIERHPVSPDKGYWWITNGSVQVNGKSVQVNSETSPLDTIIDTGTTFMYGPPSEVDTFYKQVPGAYQLDTADGVYAFPCHDVPDVSFSWGGKEWNIGKDTCVPRRATRTRRD
ncbi:acid protease [Amylocystis lapponica]|nr:acid protease [Amylocystis lapponica]